MNKFLSVLLVLIIVTALSFTSYSLINNTIVNFIINFIIVLVGATIISKFIKVKFKRGDNFLFMMFVNYL